MKLAPYQSVLELNPEEFGPESLEGALQQLWADDWYIAAIIVPVGTPGDEMLFNREMVSEWKGIPFIVMDVPPQFEGCFKLPCIKIFSWKYEETKIEEETPGVESSSEASPHEETKS